MSKLSVFLLENEEQMNLYTQAISKVHVKNHPEVLEIQKLYQSILQKIKNGTVDVSYEFRRLDEITNHFSTPKDVCQTYEAVIEFLKEAFYLHNDLVG
ncbi:iron-sulfur cluster repair di-iron protein, ric [Globicatella sanguinis]